MSRFPSLGRDMPSVFCQKLTFVECGFISTLSLGNNPTDTTH